MIGWNDLGMHCLDDTYDTFSILPPYNNLWAQVVREPAGGGEPQVVTNGVTVEYSFVDNTYWPARSTSGPTPSSCSTCRSRCHPTSAWRATE